MAPHEIDPNNPRCFLDVEVEGNKLGRLIFELFVDKAPKTVENFRAICTGECGISETSGVSLHYINSIFHKVVPGEVISAGGLGNSGKSESIGVGESIFGESFEVETYDVKHERPGILSMETNVAQTDSPETSGSSVSSFFSLTLARRPDRDQRCCAFGCLIRGFGVLREIEKMPTGSKQQPLKQVVVWRCGELEPGDDGIEVGSDGDPFTPWPQDYPNMGDKGDQYLARVAASETIKSFGNEAFKAGDFITAHHKYTKALRYLEKKYVREAEVYAEEMAHRDEQRRHSIPLLLNLAAVQLKLGEFRDAIESCNKVHQWENSTRSQVRAEVWNPKMLYRRGLARAACNEFEAAIEDLGRAAMMQPANPDVRRELDKVVRNMEARKSRERAAYSKMFA